MFTCVFARVHSVSSFNLFLKVESRLLISSAPGFWGCCRVDIKYVMVVVLSSSIFWPVQRGHDCGLQLGDSIRSGGPELHAICQGAMGRGRVQPAQPWGCKGEAACSLYNRGCCTSHGCWINTWAASRVHFAKKKRNVLWTCYHNVKCKCLFTCCLRYRRKLFFCCLMTGTLWLCSLQLHLVLNYLFIYWDGISCSSDWHWPPGGHYLWRARITNTNFVYSQFVQC